MRKKPIMLLTTLLVTLWWPDAYAGNGANFVLYTHKTPEAGEMEIMLMNDFAQEADGSQYEAQMIEFEMGVTDKLAMGFMIEGQHTVRESGYNFTGFRWETRYRPLEYTSFFNPVLYVEYEDLAANTKYLMEVSGRSDTNERTKARPERERVLESRLILGASPKEDLDIAISWLNESDLDTGVTAFGYAMGLNYALLGTLTGQMGHDGDASASPVIGLELYGGVGDSDKGVTSDSRITEHYMGVNFMIPTSEGAMVTFGGAIGLTNISQDLFRVALGYDF